MKMRSGFVSNSSSCSFICDACGHVESGWYLFIEDADMAECEEGHVFCRDHADADLEEKIEAMCKQELKEEGYDESSDDFEMYLEDAVTNRWYSVNKELCPLCTNKYVSDEQLIDHLLKKVGMLRVDVENEIRLK